MQSSIRVRFPLPNKVAIFVLLFTFATPPTVNSDWSIFHKAIKLEAMRTGNRLVSYEANGVQGMMSYCCRIAVW